VQVVNDTRVFSHCGKAFMRGQLWEPESWPEPDAVRSSSRTIAGPPRKSDDASRMHGAKSRPHTVPASTESRLWNDRRRERHRPRRAPGAKEAQ
jgi:hypothetical protein